MALGMLAHFPAMVHPLAMLEVGDRQGRGLPPVFDQERTSRWKQSDLSVVTAR